MLLAVQGLDDLVAPVVPAGDGAEHRVLERRRERVLLQVAPAAALGLVVVVELFDRGLANVGELALGRSRSGALGLAARQRARIAIGDQAAQDLGEHLGLSKATQLEDRLGGGGQDAGGGPTPRPVALGDVRTRVGVHPDRHEVLGEQRRDLGIGVGLLLHHVAPVAPLRDDVDQDDPVLVLRPLERRALPVRPVDLGVGSGGVGGRGGLGLPARAGGRQGEGGEKASGNGSQRHHDGSGNTGRRPERIGGRTATLDLAQASEISAAGHTEH